MSGNVTDMGRYRIVSADAHILEPPHIWERWLPEPYQDQAPKLVKDSEAATAGCSPALTEPDPIGLTATPGMAVGPVPVDRRDLRRGAGRLLRRRPRGSKDMDIDGVDAEVLFPPQRTIGHFLGDDDDDFVLAGVEAYNNFLLEEFCAPDPTRLVGMAQIPRLGIDDAVDTLRKAKARGFKGVVISNWPAGGDSIRDEDDPFWAAAAGRGRCPSASTST